ncbi:class I SAM-dependent methyltransferase [Camelimonas sp. ID_303_24]
MSGSLIDEAAVAAAWDSNADQWTADVQAGRDLYRDLYTLPAFLDFIPGIQGKTVLDLGCGEGSNTRRFAGLGADVTGIDISPRMIAAAQARENAGPAGVRYLTGSFCDMPAIAAESFDVALSTLALMDSPDFPAAMREVRRVLRPGGRLAFSVLHPCFITPATRWQYGDDGRATGLHVGGYFDQQPFIERWRFGKSPLDKSPFPAEAAPFSVPRFPATLSEYLNGVIAAGLRITRMDEPRPDEALAKQHPWLARWRLHAPLALLIEAER